MLGTTGRLLRVDLSKERIKTEKLSEQIVQTYSGGKCLGAKLLYEELEPDTDPLGPDNKLVFATGPLTGVPFPGHSRYVVMAKSPITDGWGESHAGGFFGPELKYAGYDVVVFEGKSEKPIYLWIREEDAELKSAEHIWGKITGGTENEIRKETGDKHTRIAAIGPGGERLVKYACIISDLYCAAGRCGMGAVMGSKNLKAVAVQGSKRVAVANPDGVNSLRKTLRNQAMKGWGQPLFLGGTAKDLEPLSLTGRLPTKAFRKSTFKDAQKITGDMLTQTILKGRLTCPSCPVAHYRAVETKGRYVTEPKYGGPEYESCAALGSLCMNADLEAIAKANELCNKYGIDTIATGATVAFIMECFEKGLLSEQDTGGLRCTWGNGDAIIKLIPQIANREGIGHLLAEGVKHSSEMIGGGSEEWALHVKGAVLPMHEPRGKKGMGLTYATSNRGASHLQVYHDDSFVHKSSLAPEIGIDSSLVPQKRTETGARKVRLVKISEDLMGLYNSLVVCRFVFYPAGISVGNLVQLFRAVTGWAASPKELMRIGERSLNITRCFNAREGFTREDDVLPERVMDPLKEGGFKGEGFSKDVLDTMLTQYYSYRGWDQTRGWPTKEKLKELELGWIVSDLSRRGLR